ncbi:putative phage abortive infection protein [Thalassospira lucentensis]|uniref:putative phage abortive infection protein n=1 Tax=Thalassospira lucentensis TaxID=168935 RepID=UPI003D2F3C20
MEKEEKGENKWFSIAFAISVVLAGLALVGMIWFGVQKTSDFKELGQWGDFFGGTLNPIFTFVTILGLLLTIVLQRSELILSRKELSRSATALEGQINQINSQKFESTLFQMLSMLNEIVDAIEVIQPSTRNKHKGRDAFTILYSTMQNSYQNQKNSPYNHQESRDFTDTELVNLSMTRFMKEYAPKIAHYCRYLYNIFKFLDENEHSQQYHSRMVRSQLSNQELKLLFYNCLSDQGTKFKLVAEEHALFDNLPTSELFETNHKLSFNDKAFGIENAAE